ncbi:MAG: TRAP transporter small permease [Magnetovibrionaceae bacterium]
MSASHPPEPQGGLAGFVDHIEETLIALLLGLMTVVTFANVVARYVFNDNLLWALETTVFLFAWLVLLGVSYAVKRNLHLGVDVFVNMMPHHTRKYFALAAVACCLFFSVLLLIGSWDYWYPFATKRAWLETDDVPMPFFLTFLEGLVNEGEAYEKMPRFIPYMILPISMALLTYRFLQVGWNVWTDKIDLIIASHEAEEMEETMKQHPIGED